MGISHSGQFDDQVDVSYVSDVITVGTTEVLASVGASNLAGRQELLIYNDSNRTIYVGPSGVSSSGANKGIPIEPGETFNPPGGDGLNFYLIVALGTANAIIQELA